MAAAPVLAVTVAISDGPASAATAPNGLIAYAAWDEEQSGHDVWLTDPADPGAAPRRLTKDGKCNNNPDWSPEGTRIAYDDYADFGSRRIWSMDAYRRLDAAVPADVRTLGRLLLGLPAGVVARRPEDRLRRQPLVGRVGDGWLRAVRDRRVE